MGQGCPPWPADQVERRSLDSLIPYARNSRTHTEAQVAQLAASMREWGFTVPVLIDEDGTIISGHGRVLAARQLGIDEVPVVIARGWSDAKRRAYIIADNKLAQNAEWDRDMLAAELQELDTGELDLALTGFSEPELINLLAQDGTTSPSDEWQGMPEFEQEDKSAFRSIMIHFRDEDAVNTFSSLLGRPLPDARYMWFPDIEIEHAADKHYASDS